MAEKLIKTLTAIRVDEPLEVALMRLAAGADRKLSDYIRLVLREHVRSHAITLADEPSESEFGRD